MEAAIAHERLSRARASRGEDVKALSSRTGLREATIRAIEDGRFDALPPGLYARAAIRTYASALGLDPAEILDACAAALPPIEEPIRAMARLRGLRPVPIAAAEADVEDVKTDAAPASPPNWRWLAAAALDACVIGTMLVALITTARVATAVPVTTLGRPGAIAFAVMGIVLSIAYFAWFGGLGGTTAGERALGIAAPAMGTPRVTLDVVTARAARCATDDLRFVAASGAHCRQIWNAALLPPPRATTCSSSPRDL